MSGDLIEGEIRMTMRSYVIRTNKKKKKKKKLFGKSKFLIR